MIVGYESGWLSLEWFALIHPLKIELPSARAILLLSTSVRCLEKGFVNKSASWSWVWTCPTWSALRWTRSRTKWRSIWMCFIIEWWTGLKLRWIAPRLSQSSDGVDWSLKPSSWRRECIQTVSEAALARALYWLTSMIVPLHVASLSSRRWDWNQESWYRLKWRCDHQCYMPNQHLKRLWELDVSCRSA